VSHSKIQIGSLVLTNKQQGFINSKLIVWTSREEAVQSSI